MIQSFVLISAVTNEDLISPQQVCTQGSQSHDYRVEDGHEARGEHKPHQHHLTLGTL